MIKFLFSIGLAVLAGISTAAFGADNAGSLTAQNWNIDIRDGMVVSGKNTITGESLVISSKDSPGLAGLYRTGGKELLLSAAGKVENDVKPGSIIQSAEWSDAPGASCVTRFTKDASGDLVINQEGKLSGKGLYGISWGIAEIPDTYTVLVPGESGQRFGADTPSGMRSFDYPFVWEAPFVIIHGKKGGFIIRAEDPDFQFKTLFLEHVNKSFRLRFESRNQAPFEDKDSIRSVKWKVSAYKGTWQAGAEIYHKWMKNQYKITPIDQKKPAWAKDIRFAVTMGMDTAVLKELAKKVNPKQTLLYIPSWRRDGYDRNYPDYTALPEFGPFVKEAHKLGYRVMAHVNYFGCDPKHPAYAELNKYQLRDPFSKEPQWWWPPIDLTIKFAYINPASSAWRKLFVSKMEEIVRDYNVDAFHIDQTLVMINDANGLVDGMNCIQGNIQLHKDLNKALPEIAISGEGLDEVTCMYETFAQRHEMGIDLWNGNWNDQRLAQAHPVSSYVLAPYTIMYGYLGMPNPVANPGTFTAWRRAYERYGVIPTYPWPSVSEIKKADMLADSIINDARLFQKYKITPDFTTKWEPDDLFVYKLSDGRKAFYRKDNGMIFGISKPNGKVDIISRRLSGTNEVAGGGSIPGWLAYNDRAIIGLDPAQTYQWSPKPRDPGTLHISSMPAGKYKLAQGGKHSEFARFKLDSLSNTIELWNYTGDTSSGVKFSDGTEKRYAGMGFSDPTGSASQPDGDGIAVHPPWKPAGQNPAGFMNATSLGDAFIDFKIDLPKADKITFNSGIVLRTGAEGKSDGVILRIRAESEGKTITGEIDNDKETPKYVSLDLSPFAGKNIILRFEVNPGPADNVSFDWSRIIRPVINIEAHEQESVDIVSSEPITSVLIADGKTGVQKISADTYRVNLSLPNTIILPLFIEPVTVTLPFDILKAKSIDNTVTYDGHEGPKFEYGNVSVDESACRGEKRASLATHPPSFGKIFANYYLTLPKDPAHLVTTVGIRETNKSKGLMFEVQVNGKSMMQRKMFTDEGWIPVDIDLLPWVGKTVLLSLIVDSLGSCEYDWAVWGEPKLVE
ncbi:MAG: DUF6259 domain-containing protein [Armatimonadota bacterium]